MRLASGTRLGAYEILSALGAGGMGEVYKAHDTRLKRSVALKVLSSDLLAVATARERFHREAVAIAALQHPNICTIYDVGETPEGHPFIVMELLEGETLHQRLAAGSLPAASVVTIGIALADALAAAHAAGLIHRDIKPANILVTAHGPKILDFGLAKTIAQVERDARTMQPTIAAQSHLTHGDSTVGTLAYMSPEQLSGLPLDARTDLFSLGAVFYEMATGRPAFPGATSALISAAILHDAPVQPREWRPDLPVALELLILKALEKDRDVRCQSAAELRADLKRVKRDLDSSPSSADRPSAPGGRSPRIGTSPAPARSAAAIAPAMPSDAQIAVALVGRHRALAIAGGAGALVLAGLLAYGAWTLVRSRQPPGEASLVRVLASDLPVTDPALSPDGTTVVYVADDESGRTDLFVSRVAGGARVRLTNDDLKESRPRFSPNGETIVFSRRRADGGGPDVCSVPALGGQASVIVRDAAYPVLSPDGTRIVFVHNVSGERRVATARSDGSDVRDLAASTAALPFVRNPAWSPVGRTIAFVMGAGGAAGDIWIASADGTGAPRRLTADAGTVFSDEPAFSPDGRAVVHASNRGGAQNIWSIPVDGGPPTRLTSGAGPDDSPTVDRLGRVAFINSRWRSELLVYGPNGGAGRSIARHVPYLWAPAFSPDGRDLAFTRSEVDGSWHIWVSDATGANARQLTSTDRGEIYPRWTPDGLAIVFGNWSPPRRIWRVPRDGGPPAPLTPADRDAAYGDVSPDGSLAFTITDGAEDRLYVMPLQSGSPLRLVRPGRAAVPKWSPDGRWIAFAADRSPFGGIFIVRPDGSEERRLTPSGGWPVWWPDGRHIVYTMLRSDETQELKSVSLDASPPPALPSIRFNGTNFPADVSRDGSLSTSNGIHTSSEIWVLDPRR